MKMEGLTPIAPVRWVDLNKPDDYNRYGIVLEFDPANNEAHKKFLGEIRELCSQELTAEGAKKPYWQGKDDKDRGTYCIRFSSQYVVEEWMDAEDQEIQAPRRVDRGTEVQVKYKLGVSQGQYANKYLNTYVTGCKIVRIPAKSEEAEKAKAYEDEDDVPF